MRNTIGILSKERKERNCILLTVIAPKVPKSLCTGIAICVAPVCGSVMGEVGRTVPLSLNKPLGWPFFDTVIETLAKAWSSAASPVALNN